MKLTEKIREYIEGRCATKLEPLEKELAKAEKEKSADEFAEFRLEWYQRKQALLDKFKSDVWLDDASRRAKQVSLVTHALKYTHSDAKGSSVFHVVTEQSQKSGLLNSSTLSNFQEDIVCDTAAAMDVAKLLLLKEADGKRLFDWVAEGDPTPFIELGSDEQIQSWLEGFRQALQINDPASHSLAKQLYFPVNDAKNSYHLLAPLSASSLNQKVFERVKEARFSESSKAARKAKRNGLYWDHAVTDFPSLAQQHFGGGNKQNVSLLNSQRNGVLYFFNTRSPTWKFQSKPPKSVDAFWSGYRWRIRKQLDELKGFLEWANQHGLNNRHVRRKRADMVAGMVDELHQYAAQLRQFPAGWAAEPMGNSPEACWVDPARDDTDFQYEREGKAWCKKLALNFGRVLSKAIDQKGKRAKLSMSDVETAHFKQQIQRQAYLLMIDLEELV